MKYVLVVWFLLSLGGMAVALPLSGTKSVGPAGDYASLTAAIADIQVAGNGLGGVLVLELKSNYVSTVETFPLTIPALNGASAENTLTIRPASGATGLAISSSKTSAATVDLNGAQFVTIDGRPGGLGTAKQLTIANTSTSGVALRLINEASLNTVSYTTLKSVNTSTLSGTVVFSTTTGAYGNDNNTLDHCDVCDGASTPANGIYAEGTGTSPDQNNSGNVITSCNVFNFYRSTAVDAAGVKLTSGNTQWTISGNSFYQTVIRTPVDAVVRAIYLSNTSNHSHTVTGNFIGGSAPNAEGSAWTIKDTTQPYQFVGIWLRVSSSTASSVQGNVIKNFYWRSAYDDTTQPGAWCGIHVETGKANIGTVTGNIIGSDTGTGSITVVPEDGGMSYGISAVGSSPLTIANNTIGSITTYGTTTGDAASLTGIRVINGSNVISNNLVGSTTTANSLIADSSNYNGSISQQVIGIQSSSNDTTLITGNTVANLYNKTAQTLSAAQIRGIVTSAGTNTISGNTVRNLGTASRNTSLSVVGISQTGTGNQTISKNVIHSLNNFSNVLGYPLPDAAVTVTGIYFFGADGATCLIDGNLVHSLLVNNGSATSEVRGLFFHFGTFTAQNNMVRLGIDANGDSPDSASKVLGIRDNVGEHGRYFYHNSVFVGGVATSGATKTYAFSSVAQSTTREYRGNIFVNARSNNGGTGKHYAVSDGGVSSDPSLTAMTADNNIYFVSGTGGVLGYYNGGDRSTIAAWRTATGQDAASLVTDPLFLAPTGTAETVDLHIASSSPANNAGLPVAGVTKDFDGEIRSIETPTIGADEIPAPNIAVKQSSALADGVGSVNFGSVGLGSSSAAKTFTITNTGGADLNSFVVTGGSGEFAVGALSGASIPAGSGSVTFTVTFGPSVLGTRGTTLHIASNVAGAKNPFDIALIGTGVTEQEGWRLNHFGSMANSGAGADEADFDHDGVSNLFEFIGGLDPADPASVFKWRIEPVLGEPTKMKVIFGPIAAGRSYTVQTSPTPGTAALWTSLVSGVTSDNGSERTVTDMDATGGAKFYRVLIDKP